MPSQSDSEPGWGSQYRLVASEKWKAKSAAMGQPVTDALVEYAAPAPGMCVLDLASGTGEPAISLAGRVGEQGHVTALDLSAELLEIAAERARARALTNFTTQQGDAHSLPFPANSFDLATSRFGVMFFRAPEARTARVASRSATRSTGVFSGVGKLRSAVLAEHDGRGAPSRRRPFAGVRRGGSFSICGGRQPFDGSPPCRIR